MKALAPVTKAFYLQQVFAVTEQIKVRTFPELAARAKAKEKQGGAQAGQREEEEETKRKP